MREAWERTEVHHSAAGRGPGKRMPCGISRDLAFADDLAVTVNGIGLRVRTAEGAQVHEASCGGPRERVLSCPSADATPAHHLTIAVDSGRLGRRAAECADIDQSSCRRPGERAVSGDVAIAEADDLTGAA